MAQPTREILTRWQRPVVKLLLGGFVLLAATGLFLLRSDGASSVASWALLAHVVVGILLVPLLLAFTVPHAMAQMRRKPVIGFTGALVMGLGLASVYTGVLLLLERSSLRADWVWPVHVFCGLGMPLVYAVHRRFGQNPASFSRLSAGVAFILALGFAITWLDADGGVAPEATADGPRSNLLTQNRFGLSNASTADGKYLADSAVLTDMNRCVDCHPRIVQETLRSAHKFASMSNPFYRGTIQEMRRTYPLVDTKWCAGCHDPALLFTGIMDDPDLDFESADATLGITCMACHAIQPRSNLGNGDYIMEGRKIYAWERYDDPVIREVHDILLEAKPEGHTQSLRPHNVFTGEFCGTCHKAEVPPELNRWKWLRVQDEYDHWHDSGVSLNNVRSFYHPPAAKRCQDCHMPLVPDPQDPSADADGLIRSHLFAAANTALPYLRGDQDMIRRQTLFLQNAVRVDVTGILLPSEDDSRLGRPRLFAPAHLARPAVKPGDIIEAHVVVRNFGVGHRFPGGTTDSNEVWVHFEVSVGDRPAFFSSGLIDPETGLVDPTAEFYRSYVMNKAGERVVNRVGPDVYTRVYGKQIGPGTADVVRYRFRVPEGTAETLKIKVTLRYRKFMREYIDFLYPHDKVIEYEQMDGTVKPVDLTRLPVVDMWSDTLELPVTAEGTTGPAPEPIAVIDPEPRRLAGDIELPKDRERINDLGIGYLLQNDVYWALYNFDQVTQIEPTYADGWVNIGRARIAAKDDQGALEALRKARDVEPGFAKARFFEGSIFQRRLKFADAEAAYREVLLQFPKERATLKNLAKVLWEQGRAEEALEVLERMIAIDAEDWEVWRLAVAVYKDLGQLDRVEAATTALRRFKRDDDEQVRAAEFRNADPNLERMSQRIHTHVQPEIDTPR